MTTPRYTQSSVSEIATGYHNAFPGVARTASGHLVIVYRYGNAHVGGWPGVVMQTHSDDGGTTWTTPVEALSESGIDLRDPALATLADGRIAMTLFRYSGGVPLGVSISYSSDDGHTWSTLSPLSFGFTGWSACSGPLAEPVAGTLVALAYGVDTGSTIEHVRAIVSTDNGATWGSSESVLSGALRYQEPFAGAMPGGVTMVDIRQGGGSPVRRRVFRDAEGTWSEPVEVATGTQARPAWIRTSEGHIILGDRLYLAPKFSMFAVQADEDSGAGEWERLTADAEETMGTYQQMVELDDGMVGVAFCYERGAYDSRLCWTTLTPPRRRALVMGFL